MAPVKAGLPTPTAYNMLAQKNKNKNKKKKNPTRLQKSAASARHLTDTHWMQKIISCF
jgi:hypothetical protein